MNRLYLTQDTIGSPSGGGVVTKNEYLALQSFANQGALIPVDALQVPVSADPFETDLRFLDRIQELHRQTPFQIAHIYAGCFSKTVKWMKSNGIKVSYTAAAHDPDVSMAEFKKLGIPYQFTHMSDPALRDKYLEGYRLADMVICPSSYSANIMRDKFGCKRVTVIQHGITGPARCVPLPKVFTVGYLGAAGPDKGLRYLLEAWKALDWRDDRLVIAGKNIDSVLPLWRQIGGRVELHGWVENVEEFYDSLSVYVQPSVTEGFGIEIIEAITAGRPVIASDGAGASEHVTPKRGIVVKAGSSEAIGDALGRIRDGTHKCEPYISAGLLWEVIKGTYHHAWSVL